MHWVDEDDDDDDDECQVVEHLSVVVLRAAASAATASPISSTSCSFVCTAAAFPLRLHKYGTWTETVVGVKTLAGTHIVVHQQERGR